MLRANREADCSPKAPSFPRKYLFYIIVILYLVGDLYWFGGPLRRYLEDFWEDTESLTELAQREGIVATVNAHPIRRQELDRAVIEYLHKNGLSIDVVSRQRLNAIRVLVLDELVIDRLIWFHSYHTAVELTKSEMNEALSRFRRSFENHDTFKRAALAQGFSEKRLDAYLQNQAMQRAWIEKIIEKYIAVEEKEILARYESDFKASLIPERVRARQIFMPTLKKDSDQIKGSIQEVFEKLKAGEKFEDLALQFSEDPKTKDVGGDLGWFTRDRIPEAFYDEVVKIGVGQVGEPFETDIGWHLVQIIDRKKMEKAPLEMVRDELSAVIESEKRQRVIDTLIDHLKSKAKIRYTGQFTWVE